MKRYLIFILALLLCQTLFSQSNPVDELFNRYSEKEGYTYVSISGRMLNLIGSMDAEKNPENLMLRLKSIKILTQDDSLAEANVNFYQELSRKLNIGAYEELMVVKEGNDVTKFLVRQNGDAISELLVISGGRNGNSLISIRGEINLQDLSRLSKETGIKELEKLEGMEDRD